MNIIASPSGFSPGESFYVKGAFYQDVPNPNYFGYTKNGDNWIKNSDSTVNQKLVKIDDWDKALTVKSDFTDSGYKGEGGYKFKIGFYYLTSSGKPSSISWGSSVLDVWINEPDPTATPEPTDTPEPTNIPSPVLNAVTSTPTPASKLTPTLTPKPTAKPTQKPTPTISKDLLATESGVLGESSESAKPTRKPQKTEVLSSKSHNIIPIVLIFLGIVFLIACVAVFSYPYIIRFINKNKDE